MSIHIGQRVGNYQLTRLLGRGGFAEVYLGEHQYLQTQAALKLLHEKFSPHEVQGFIQEAKTIAALKHPHIIRIHDFGLEQGMPYLVMDYASNGTLRERHPRGTLIPLPQILVYLKQIGAALAYAHEHKWIHRDIKPENMLLTEQNQVVLSDFGIAAIAHSTASMQRQNSIGTAHYMAPEQLRGYPVPNSDQYSLGIVVYEWLCGERPFSGANMVEIAMKHATEPVPSLKQKVPELTLQMQHVIYTSLEKDPKRRFPNIKGFVQAFEQALSDLRSQTPTQAVSSTDPIQMASATPLPPRPERELADNWLQKGNSYFANGQYEEALAADEQAVRADPTYGLAYLRKGMDLENLRRYKEALATYEQAIRVDPLCDALVYRRKGDVLNALGRRGEAEAAYTKARLLWG